LKLLPTELGEAKIELLPYLMESFGNSTRIDYGSGRGIYFFNNGMKNISWISRLVFLGNVSAG